MTTIHVEVTREDIRKGVKGDYKRCAIACALTRMGVPDVTVEPGMSDGLVTTHGGIAEYHLPIAANTWAVNFDEDKRRVRPFSFDLDPYDDHDGP